MAWTCYVMLTCYFIGEISKECVDISAEANWYNATETMGNLSS